MEIITKSERQKEERLRMHNWQKQAAQEGKRKNGWIRLKNKNKIFWSWKNDQQFWIISHRIIYKVNKNNINKYFLVKMLISGT